jgi:DNA-directed RNA polymerase specialized sigma24 family protein
MRGVNALAPTAPRRAALRRSFGEAAADHLDAVHRDLLLLTAEPSLAEDLTAETFEKALRTWRRFDPRWRRQRRAPVWSPW